MHRNSWRFVRNNGCLDTGLLEPPKYWGYGIYIDFRFALPIPFFVYLCLTLRSVRVFPTPVAPPVSAPVRIINCVRTHIGIRTCASPILYSEIGFCVASCSYIYIIYIYIYIPRYYGNHRLRNLISAKSPELLS